LADFFSWHRQRLRGVGGEKSDASGHEARSEIVWFTDVIAILNSTNWAELGHASFFLFNGTLSLSGNTQEDGGIAWWAHIDGSFSV
jgi:hypothetical protein